MADRQKCDLSVGGLVHEGRLWRRGGTRGGLQEAFWSSFLLLLGESGFAPYGDAGLKIYSCSYLVLVCFVFRYFSGQKSRSGGSIVKSLLKWFWEKQKALIFGHGDANIHIHIFIFHVLFALIAVRNTLVFLEFFCCCLFFMTYLGWRKSSSARKTESWGP